MIIRLSTLGNVAMLVPTLTQLSMTYPDDRFVLVALKPLQPLLYGLDNFRFHEADAQVEAGRGLWQLAKQIAAYQPSKVFDLQGDYRGMLLRWMMRLRHIPTACIRRGAAERRRLIRLGAERCNRIKTESERYYDTFVAGGLRPTGDVLPMKVNSEALSDVKQLFGEKKGHWIGIAPFAKHVSNVLPYKTMKELIGYYAHQPDTRVFLFGGGHIEIEMLRQWSSLWPNVESVSDRLSMGGELELMRLIDGMICMDSANQHLAAIVGCPILSIWCGTHPYMGFAAWGKANTQMLSLPLTCRPCSIHGTNTCKYRNFACKAITSEQIAERFNSMLSNK